MSSLDVLNKLRGVSGENNIERPQETIKTSEAAKHEEIFPLVNDSQSLELEADEFGILIEKAEKKEQSLALEMDSLVSTTDKFGMPL